MAKKKTDAMSLGERIRAMRKKQKLSDDQLAEKTGYDAEYIRGIESGEISPPVGALIQISKALAVESAAFLKNDKKKERRKSYRKRTKAYSYRNLNPGAQDNHLWAYMVTLAPKKAHEKVEYKHEGEEFVHVMEGRVEIRVGKETHVMKKGASLHFDASTPHQLRNLSTKESKLLVVVYTP